MFNKLRYFLRYSTFIKSERPGGKRVEDMEVVDGCVSLCILVMFYQKQNVNKAKEKFPTLQITWTCTYID